MERTVARVAAFPARKAVAAAGAPSTPSCCTIHWLRRDDGLPRVKPKRIAVLDPFEVEQRLLVALAQAQGHPVILCRDAEELAASIARDRPDIAFVHICFALAIQQAVELEPRWPPVVLIDSCGIAGRGPAQFDPIGDFAALRFPIGLREFAEAVRRNAR
jgi:hypothetical protein